MPHKKIAMEHDKKIALVAHDNKKQDLVEWAKYNRTLLAHHAVYATGTTGKILEQELGFKIERLQSGPLGGDHENDTPVRSAFPHQGSHRRVLPKRLRHRRTGEEPDPVDLRGRPRSRVQMPLKEPRRHRAKSTPEHGDGLQPGNR